ncbi:hypothetical protein [Hyphococcus luteus]|uniref:Uncharacterized protein n=1 Tax=Hyphococcus luteus TaxID=2058213 RepID=A0A2S7KAC4_9PROT|nr:hypothetical protein [Marinicaulis flavus]PQA89452.1 hypothetical protein CW354_00845 [Marinicaulis flavus]
MSPLKMSLIGAGAAAAAGVVVMTQTLPDKDGAELTGAPARELCLKGDFAFFADIPAGCYSYEQIRNMANAPLVDRRGAKVTVNMTHPTDMSAAPVEVGNCRDYRKARFGGWYAPTSRDMRREAYFIRACGTLAMLSEAQEAKHAYFDNGSPRSGEIADLAAKMTFGEMSPTPGDVRVKKEQGHVWRISAGDISIAIHEIANADFDNDGVEEILAFMAGAPQGGTAAFYEAGLLEKDAPEAALAFTPFAFTGDEAGETGG